MCPLLVCGCGQTVCETYYTIRFSFYSCEPPVCISAHLTSTPGLTVSLLSRSRGAVGQVLCASSDRLCCKRWRMDWSPAILAACNADTPRASALSAHAPARSRAAAVEDWSATAAATRALVSSSRASDITSSSRAALVAFGVRTAKLMSTNIQLGINDSTTL